MSTPELNHPVDPVLRECMVQHQVIRGFVNHVREGIATWTPGPMPVDFDVSTAPHLDSYFSPEPPATEKVEQVGVRR